ncbi:hypothetical protein GGTG_12478 [Gaeumannomyces tritici R3-111a-1]|uniref:Calcium uniporter protein, mitochondrial n=1 Tax=Gaeumannomyces tritici (strain R3-111a-1) TaxID=644352 RepID=J3PG52_GAET3|nr:hypothetical protein GGTG_12478 [Gaeumannomyces tritici R3-111a-1]EJT70306.1 hypothetical protein GGTG_12478 [Gaeumannomyces tritici R3-111a-1]
MNNALLRLGLPARLSRLPRPTPSRLCAVTSLPRPLSAVPPRSSLPALAQQACRSFTPTARHCRRSTPGNHDGDDVFAARARDLNQKGLDEEEKEVRLRQHQVKRPWHRDKADEPPVKDKGGAGKDEELSKGKLLTTPTRLLKLIIPLPVSVEKDRDNNSKSHDFGRSISSNDEIQPLALLIHPQQPLSYVERLIQAELPPVMEDGKEKIPNVYFRAEDASAEGSKEKKDKATKEKPDKGNPHKPSGSHVASYSGLGHEASARADEEKRWVRWSSSTEMGDFIRDAARGREFVIEVEGYGLEMRVGVPSFNDRTHFLRTRLRRMSRSIDRLVDIKRECDELAHRSAHRLAQGGFGLLASWWGVVYYVTFHTEAGWDLVEPVTYLAGLATIMAGYLWFLFISRDLSYKAAMNVTVSRRRTALYEARGFDVARWEQLVREANALRAEVMQVAQEYDVDWDETADLGSEDVKDVLAAERHKRKARADPDEDEDDGDGDDKKEDKSSGRSEAADGSGKADGGKTEQKQEKQAGEQQRKG